jgi:hypothetical protein
MEKVEILQNIECCNNGIHRLRDVLNEKIKSNKESKSFTRRAMQTISNLKQRVYEFELMLEKWV